MSNQNQSKDERLSARYASERRFILYGQLAIGFGVLALSILLITIFSRGYSAFLSTELQVSMLPYSSVSSSKPSDLDDVKYRTWLNKSLKAAFPFITSRSEGVQMRRMFSKAAQSDLEDRIKANPELLSSETGFEVWVRASSDVDQIYKGNAPIDIEEERRLINDSQLRVYQHFLDSDAIRAPLNFDFLFRGDSRSPELAGVGGAIVGSFFTLAICVALAFPVAVAAAVYLEEFAPKNRWTEFIEVNINNLAAVPSIIFGLLGLAVILNIFGVPRGTAVAGGIVLALRTLPVIMISCRASLKAVPPSIRQGAMAMGASPMQVVLHHVLPLAMPGTLTGTIIGLAQALGETAPLLLIGMVAFVVDIPQTPLETSTVLPVQIYLWAESAERGFAEKTSAAIMIILNFLFLMNFCAVLMRNRFERRW